MKLGQQLTTYKKINSKWIKDLKVSHHTIKILDKNTVSNISDISHSNVFADTSPRGKEIKK